MNPYEVLNLDKLATPAQIKKAYLSMAKKHHPDAGGSTEQFALVAWAYELLSDPDRRAHFDQTGGDKSPGPDPLTAVAGCITMLWETVLSEPGEVKYKDLVKNMKSLALKNRKAILSKVKDASKVRKDLKAMKTRLTYSGKSINPLGHWIDRNLGMMETSIRQLDEEYQTYKQVLKHLEDYSWQKEEKPKPKESQWSQVWYDEADRIPEKYINMFKDPRR